MRLDETDEANKLKRLVKELRKNPENEEKTNEKMQVRGIEPQYEKMREEIREFMRVLEEAKDMYSKEGMQEEFDIVVDLFYKIREMDYELEDIKDRLKDL